MHPCQYARPRQDRLGKVQSAGQGPARSSLENRGRSVLHQEVYRQGQDGPWAHRPPTGNLSARARTEAKTKTDRTDKETMEVFFAGPVPVYSKITGYSSVIVSRLPSELQSVRLPTPDAVGPVD